MSAWTARVLSGLVEDAGPEFPRFVRLISSVSGGSVGALYFLASYRNGELDAHCLKQIFRSASRSSIDFVAWGLIYLDLLSSLLPVIPKHMDRGWAIEQAWGRGWTLPPTLDPWRQAALRGDMPAVLFNTTVAETGECIAIGTTDLREGATGTGARRAFVEVCPGVDPSPVSAARLSAGFPFVTPASAPFGQETPYHFVDGGYYDNYGTAALFAWLDQAVPQDGTSKVKRVLILRISGSRRNVLTPRPRRLLGWFYQVLAPFETLMNVRSSSQLSRQETELKLLKEAMLGRGVTVEDVAFECPAENPPLSWHLTGQEINAIENCWPAMARERAAVRAFLQIAS